MAKKKAAKKKTANASNDAHARGSDGGLPPHGSGDCDAGDLQGDGSDLQGDAGDISFEDALAEIEQIVHQLESGELDLTESLSRYERGVKQLKRCHALLDAAGRRVTLLSGFDENGQPVTETFDPAAETPTNGLEGGRSTIAEAGQASDSMDDPPSLF